jgi:hypothetical protein
VKTLTGIEPVEARSAAVIVARSWVALTTVVGRALPFQRTTDVATKLLPFTVSVRPAVPAGVLAGDSVPATGGGAITEKFRFPDVPPPGAGVKTLTATLPGMARSAVVMAARSRVALTKVVWRSAPFQRTTDVAAKPVPFTVSVKAAPPTVTLVGDRLVTAGTGSSGRSTRSVLNVAVTAVAALIVHAHVAAVPLQAPLQPAKTDPEAAVAVSVTGVPTARDSAQSAPQAMPAGALVTVPEPVPFFVTESATGGARAVNVAVTALAAFTVTVHDPLPLQAPLQPVNVDPEAAVAVSVNWVP